MPTYPEEVVFILENDAEVAGQLQRICESIDLQCQRYQTVNDWLQEADLNSVGVVILCVRIPQTGGLWVQQHLRKIGSSLTVIFTTQYGDIPTAVQAIKHGAIDFIERPFRDQEMLDRILEAVNQSRRAWERNQQLSELRQLIDQLTDREREIMEKVVTGMPNKAIAQELAISEKTVEFHRANIMRKFDVQSLAELVNIVSDYRTILNEQSDYFIVH